MKEDLESEKTKAKQKSDESEKKIKETDQKIRFLEVTIQNKDKTIK